MNKIKTKEKEKEKNKKLYDNKSLMNQNNRQFFLNFKNKYSLRFDNLLSKLDAEELCIL